MRRYSKDENFVCYECNDESEEHVEENPNATFVIEKSNDNPDEFQSDFESEISKENHDKEDVPLEDESSAHDDTSQDSIDLGEITIDGLPCAGLVFGYAQSEVEVTPPKCEVCERLFETNAELSKHMDDMHFNSCPICEKTFYRTVEKQNHIQENHSSSLEEEQNFGMNIERQSTLLRTENINKLFIQFTGDANETIRDLRKRRKGAK